MDKPFALGLIKLLAALESWGFSNKQMFADYLHEDLARHVEMLEDIVLKETENG